MLFNIYIVLFKVLYPFYKFKKTLLHLSWVSFILVILAANYDFIRYDYIKKNGYIYTYDRFTGNKWKNIQ